MFFLDANYGWTAGSAGNIWRTTNSGTNWQLIATSIGAQVFDMFFFNQNDGILAGDNGKIFATTDGGVTWENVCNSQYDNLTSIYSTDQNHCWAVGDFGAVMRTTNGGMQWEKLNSGTNLSLSDVFFLDNQLGWAVGYSGKILKTTNGGNNWLPQNSGAIWDLYDVFFVNSNLGWIASGSRIYKTTDGGIVWSLFYPNADIVQISRIIFFNELEGLLIGGGYYIGPNQAKIYKTADGGNTWSRVYNTDDQIHNYELRNAFFLDSGLGWAVGNSGLVVHTTDFGTTWNQWLKLANSDYDFFSVAFKDANTGYVLGKYGSIMSTTDGGQNWYYEVITDRSLLYSITYSEPNSFWICGPKGLIVNNNIGGTTDVLLEEFSSLIFDYVLNQNFPNPFNPTTKIKFSVPKSSNVIIKVYDVLGNEIETLVNKKIPTGNYEVNWNAANLPSGVYFYRLQTGDFAQTRKMILLK